MFYYTLYGSIAARISFGPSWHKFTLVEQFTLTSFQPDPTKNQFWPGLQRIETSFDLMPYAQAQINAEYSNLFTIFFSVGGGHLTNGFARILDLLNPIENLSLPFVNDASYDMQLVSLDINGGLLCNRFCSFVECTLLVGFNYNREKIQIAGYSVPLHYFFNNRWQGPYVGITIAKNFNNQRFLLYYKAIFGTICSSLKTQVDPAFVLQISDTDFSQRFAPAFGNILYAELIFFKNCNWRAGTSCSYINFANTKNSSIVFEKPKPFIKQGIVANVIWQQCIWDIFLEYVF